MRYELTLRCASFNLWPENEEFGLDLHQPPTHLSLDDATLSLTYAIRSYTQDRHPNEERPTYSESAAGPALWTAHVTGGRQIGTDWLMAVNEPVKARRVVARPRDGEIDVIVRCETAKPVDPEQLALLLSPVAYQLSAYLRMKLDPMLSLVYPPQLVIFGEDGKRSVNQKMSIRTERREIINRESILVAIDTFSDMNHDISKDENSRLEAASRRLFSLQAEMDLVDRFCDAWEICEITSTGVKAPGTVVGRIAACIAEHIGTQKTKSENALRLGEIYKIRCQLVHQGIDNPRGLLETLPLIENIGCEMLRWCFGLSYEGNNAIDAALQQI